MVSVDLEAIQMQRKDRESGRESAVKVSVVAKSRYVSAILAGASLVVLAQPAMAQNQRGASDQSSNDEDPDNTIVVSGIRASIENATNAKRNADQIKDVIDAEDIGKLPDTNVAEALQRVTGVQINRELGEGSEIAVRGFTQNRVEINGQTQVGAGAGGDVSYQSVTSEAFKSIEVIKTPAADEIEGALGAIVRFNTRKPLDRRRDILSVAADIQYAERAKELAPNFNLLGSTQTELDSGTRLGALFNFTYKGRKLRQDFFDVRGWDAVNGFGRDLDGDGIVGELIERDGDGIITDLQDGAYVPLQTRLQIREQDRDLYSGTVSLQAKTDTLEVYVDSTYTLNEAGDTQFQYTSSFNSALQGPAGNMEIRPVYQQPENALISPDQTVLAAILGQVNPNNGRPQRGVNLNISGNSAPFRQQIWTLSAGANWEPTDRLEVSFNFARGQGWQENDQIFSSSGVLFAEWPFFVYDFSTGTDIPSIIPLQRSDADNQATTELSDTARIDLLDLNTYRFNNFVSQLQKERNLETAYRLDLNWDVDLGPINSFEFGSRYADENGRRFRDRGRDTNNTDEDGVLGGLTFGELEALLPGIIIVQPNQDVLDGATGDYPRQWFSLDSAFLLNNQDEFLAASGVERVRDLNWGYDVERETLAAYAKANFEFDLGGVVAFGNFGLRYVHTDRTATGGVDQGDNTFLPITVDRSYDNWLPSFNLVADLGDGYFARFGAAKAMARPRLIDIAPLVNLQPFRRGGDGGNPQLLPEEVFQLDVSFEKYFGRSNLVSIALFYKDFSERIEDGVSLDCYPLPPEDLDDDDPTDGCQAGFDIFSVNTKINAGEATVKGLEAAWQQSLDFLPAPFDGLGFIANYTYIDAGDASLSPSGLRLPVQDLSEHSYNLIGYYEKGAFQARVAYNWRSEFYDEKSDSNFGSFAEPYGQLDASISVDLVKNRFSVQAEAINILNEPEIRYQEIRERLLSYRVNDRRFLVGLRWKM